MALLHLIKVVPRPINDKNSGVSPFNIAKVGPSEPVESGPLALSGGSLVPRSSPSGKII